MVIHRAWHKCSISEPFMRPKLDAQKLKSKKTTGTMRVIRRDLAVFTARFMIYSARSTTYYLTSHVETYCP